MSKDLYNRFIHIRNTLDEKEKKQEYLKIVPKADLVDEFINSESNNRTCENFLESSKERYSLELNFDVAKDDVNQLLKQIKDGYDGERLNLLIEDCKTSVLDSIIKPFGIAGIIFEDKIGGNVDTIHNVRNTDKRYNNGQGIYATDENKKTYEDRPDYEYKKYHDGNKNYKKHKENIENLKRTDQTIIDDYTKIEIGRDDTVSIEHIISASDISNDPAVSLSKANGAEIANDDINLCYINGQLNSSINSDSPSEYLDKMKRLKNPEARQNMLNYLNNKTKPLTPEEEKAKKLLEQKNAMVDNEKEVLELEKNTKKAFDKKLNSKYYTSKEFASNLGKTSAKEGLKMGVQQSIGIMIREFSLAVFSEIEYIFSKRKDIKINNEFIQDLKQRLEIIANQVMSKWRDVVVAFKDGAISGFFSNIITVIINTFFTTSKRILKIIREGFYSLLKALKMLFLPPENMSVKEAAHEVAKLIASGLIVTGGIALEETFEKSLMTIPVIGMFSDKIAPVIMGIITGLSMAFITYLIDKIDLFKVNENKRQEYISDQLNKMIDENLEEIDAAYNYILNPTDL